MMKAIFAAVCAATLIAGCTGEVVDAEEVEEQRKADKYLAAHGYPATGGIVEPDPGSAGSCAAACSKFSIRNITDWCCVCGRDGVERFGGFELTVPVEQGGNPYMYVCR